MRPVADYHMHTPLCRHATGSPSEYAAHAKAVGLDEIGFSDHSPMPQDNWDSWRMNIGELDAYVASVRQAQQDHPDLVVRLALEVDYLPGHESWIEELASRHPWDYLIGSVHYVSDWDIDNPARISEWRSRNPDDVWKAYAERLGMAAESGLFDVLGHLDLPKKFGFRPSQNPLPWFDTVLQAARARNVAIELNTAGLRKDCREIYPAMDILSLAGKHGVSITFGSDAHAPSEVGSAFDQAVLAAHAAGHRQTCRFERRQPVFVELPTPTLTPPVQE
jgi:histidinol-phosphatase (PHP family)